MAQADVVDPFGNIVDIMCNPHCLEIMGSTQPKLRVMSSREG